ncbi:MAG: 2-succinyl-5-enolpyruvyl-6-hydroxy-3-cyclohexene-1-carboxylic-acid synthase [Rhodocyclaceae bacterium]|nr:2-succinyl-5-enolpyruvyl-6-hydroxy-3-cyclohexene-1-carboxylic-acid synthase [Rhodocyclaceae bacterium]
MKTTRETPNKRHARLTDRVLGAQPFIQGFPRLDALLDPRLDGGQGRGQVFRLAAAGLRHVVLCPGARSAPLAAAFLRRPELVCHVLNDERAAGFFALGIGKASRRPAAVLVTSGTAAANLLPAVMEANHAAVPLVVLTADRPPEKVGWGANQTVEQTKLYGGELRAEHALPPPEADLPAGYLRRLAARLLDAACAPLPGPVHANLPFREPLLPAALTAPPPLPAPIDCPARAPAQPAELSAIAARLSGQPGVIVCGAAPYPAGFATALARLAAALEAPIIAEALSNLRFGPHDRTRLLAHAARFLRQTSLPRPRWVLRFGAHPLSRVIERWLATLDDGEQLLVAPPGRWPDPLWQVDTRLEGDPLAIAAALAPLCRPASADFRAAWQAAEAAAGEASAGPFFEGDIARTLLAALPAGAQLFVGSALAIRAVEAFAGSAAKPLTLHGNRGVAGIDGNLATAAGIAAASAAPLAVLVGDQTLTHDATSLALLARHDALVVLLDNGGGGIFAQLPFAAALPAELLARGWLAPPAVDFAALAAAFGLAYAIAADRQSFQAALQQAQAQGGAWLIRCVIEHTASLQGFAS